MIEGALVWAPADKVRPAIVLHLDADSALVAFGRGKLDAARTHVAVEHGTRAAKAMAP